jgi:hypothetical protein
LAAGINGKLFAPYPNPGGEGRKLAAVAWSDRII